ncbi:hypothetical protein CRYUN_Cryun01aG0031900 [Craigia yunnanensis]
MLDAANPCACCLVHRSTLFSPRKFRGHNLKLARCARFNDFSQGELSKRIEGEVQPFDDTRHVENNEMVNEKSGERGIEMNSSMQLLPSKIEFPDPYLLGI